MPRFGHYDKAGRWREDEIPDFTDEDFAQTIIPAGGRPFVLRGGAWVPLGTPARVDVEEPRQLPQTPLLVPLGAYYPDPRTGGRKWEVGLVDKAQLRDEVDLRAGLGATNFFVLQFGRWIPVQQVLALG